MGVSARGLWGLAVIVASLAAPAAAQVRVEVREVIASPMEETLRLPGNVASPQSSTLAARVEGTVEAVLVEAGERVEAGQPLLRLDETLARLELDRLRHSLAEAEHLRDDAVRLAGEAERLAGAQTVSKSRFRTLQAEAAIQESRVRQLATAVAIQRERVARHTLAAPFAGVIAERATAVGQPVGTDGTVFRLTRMDPLRVEVAVPERYYGRVAVGQPATVVPAAGETPAAGTVVEGIVPASHPVSRTFPVHIRLPNPDWSLMPGMAVRVVLPLDHGERVPAKQVPADAVERGVDGATRVWVVRAGDGGEGTVALPVAVRTGRQVGDWIEIASPELSARDVVIVRGGERLRPNQPVVVDKLG